jgi:hypothetical protein
MTRGRHEGDESSPPIHSLMKTLMHTPLIAALLRATSMSLASEKKQYEQIVIDWQLTEPNSCATECLSK